MATSRLRPISSLKTADDFLAYVQSLGIDLPSEREVQAGPGSPLDSAYRFRDRSIGNRFAILPMEGWDPGTDGRPSELTRRRWKRFGQSGAKLIWGVEAVAVRSDARGSPHQLIMKEDTAEDIAELRQLLVQSHEERFGSSNDLLVGLQLTHSGRVCRPNDWGRREPKILYHHPILDPLFNVTPDTPVMTDDEMDEVVQDFIAAAVQSQQAGFDFVDIKHCHGYLGHEVLSAVNRPGRYGGSMENRTRFLRDIVQGMKAKATGLEVGVRLSVFDFIPFRAGKDGVGEPVQWKDGPYPYAFGGDGTGVGIDLSEPFAFLDMMAEMDASLFCMSAGSSYCYHIGSPGNAVWPRAYTPPEDPLVGISRQLGIVSALKRRQPRLTYVASALSYLQELLPNVAQGIIRNGLADFVGMGRMFLSYPEIATDIVQGRPVKRNMLCRTCGACSAAVGSRLPVGCYLLDRFYREMPHFERIRALVKSE